MKRFRGSNPRLSARDWAVDSPSNRAKRPHGLCEEPTYRNKNGRPVGRFCNRRGTHLIYTDVIGAMMLMRYCGHHVDKHYAYGWHYLFDQRRHDGWSRHW